MSFLKAALMMLVVSTGASAQGRSFGPSLWSRAHLARPSGFEAAIQQVRSLDSMTYQVGYGLEPGEFYRLSQECLRFGTPDDFRRLLMDVTPLVRLMGLVCLTSSVDDREWSAAAALIDADTAVVTYTNGCIFAERATVGQVSRLIAKGQFFLTRERGALR